MSSDPTVVCSGIIKSFGEEDNRVMALRGINLTACAGEILLLLGPSGCGKTTLISIMAGILKPDDGYCKVLGQDLSQLNNNELTAFRARHVGFIFQSYNLLSTLSLTDNVAIPLIINGVRHAEARRRADDLLRQMGLGDRLDAAPNTLSGGQQQRIAIARALIHEPQLLVCDEPTSALDHKTGMYIMNLLHDAAKQRHSTLVVITHDNRILEYADRVAHMDDGRISSSPPSTLYDKVQSKGDI